jgi:sporulation protein YlmC with PRC-barrel domain
MPTNAFEDSRIAEGTLHNGARHVNNLSSDKPSENRQHRPGEEFIDGHAVKTPTGKRVLGASALIGAGVRNPAGDSLGKIEDIMLDIHNGRLAYAVLSFGGLFGIGSKLFILPWSSLTYRHPENEFILDVQREVLEKGPGFERDHWPDMADPAYGADIYRHYGKTPYWEHTVTNFGGDEFSANRCCD